MPLQIYKIGCVYKTPFYKFGNNYKCIFLQFEGPLVTAVSLYCILNGDDLFETFNKIDTQSVVVDLFSKVYLCIFMFLFIYIILSLFIGIFNHAYESLSVSKAMAVVQWSLCIALWLYQITTVLYAY